MNEITVDFELFRKPHGFISDTEGGLDENINDPLADGASLPLEKLRLRRMKLAAPGRKLP